VTEAILMMDETVSGDWRMEVLKGVAGVMVTRDFYGFFGEQAPLDPTRIDVQLMCSALWSSEIHVNR
jgi:hypothetical protein